MRAHPTTPFRVLVCRHLLSLVGGLHGPDTINVLRPTSRTKTRGDDERRVPQGGERERAGGLDGGKIEKDKFIGS